VNTTTEREKGERLFLEQLGTIERVIRFASSRAGLRDADAEDFSSYAKVRLIENDYAILRKFEERCGFTKFISIVVHRISLDYRIHLWGKWHTSAEAKRLGPVAVELETILLRDGRTLPEALPLCQRLDPTLTLQTIEDLAAKLPKRTPRTRPVEIDAVDRELSIPADSVQQPMFAAKRTTLSRSTGALVRSALDELPEDDRLLLRLRFGGDLNVAQIARVMKMEQKPLYRRIKRCLRELRRRLEASGITSDVAEEIMTGQSSDLDFGFGEESRPARPSFSTSRVGEAEEDCVDSS